MQTLPKNPFIARPAIVFLVLLVQAIGGFQIDQLIFPGTLHADISYIPARYFHGCAQAK
jgi:hypothetical protein